MEQKIYYIPIKTPDGTIKLEINHIVVNKDDEDIRVTISTTIQGTPVSYQTETTERALILLAKDLPENWCVKSCISCRHGHFCPVGNSDNELFCVTDFAPKERRDLWQVTENEKERKKRSRTLFDSCDLHKEQSKDYFTYSDYFLELNKA